MNQEMISKVLQLLPTDKHGKLQNAINQAQSIVSGKTDNDVNAIAKQYGITPDTITNIYNQYADKPLTKGVLGLLGTNPDKLKNDAMGIVANAPEIKKTETNKTSFPRLKN